VVVVVLDGVGIGKHDEGDAVFLARTPTMDRLDQTAIKTTLFAHGTHVGMPSDDDMGNSEVGHNALGAGKIYDQGAKRVDNAIRSGALFDDADPTSSTWRSMVKHVADTATLHLIGLLSDGNVHSHIDHVEALVRNAHKRGATRTRVHALLDGRDVLGQSAEVYVKRIEAVFAELNADGGDHRIASGGGRMLVTMDRYDADWGMVETGWKTHVLGVGAATTSVLDTIDNARAAKPGLNDQYLPAFVVHDADGPVGTIQDGDAVLLFNFRGDRAVELTRAFEDPEFDVFDRQRRPDVLFCGMMQYDGDAGIPANFLVSPSKISGTMGERLANAGVKQLAISETQKYGHVTYFWNGNRSDKFSEELETYIEVPSDRVVFDQRPWMKAAEITDATIGALDADPIIRFARINYPNGDMVGHTGDLQAAIISVEAADLSLARLLAKLDELGGAAIVTADHGNADQMFQLDKKTGAIVRDVQGTTIPMTAHTLNLVPLWVHAPSLDGKLELTELGERRLSNVAATALLLLGFEPPTELDAPLVRFTAS
jgi:2,3-bisphosphoglycerate-independent phosphoglycerate mutase